LVQTAQSDAQIYGVGISGGGKKVGRYALAGVLAIIVFLGALTQPGAIAVFEVQNFLTFYSGVLSLITLTGAVVFGLLATERITSVPLRILAQAVHRSSALVAVGFLVVHIVLMILAERATVVDAIIPFVEPSDRVLYVGIGTIASHLMLLTFAVGLIRRRFIRSSHKWIWRLLHCMAYVSWPIAIVHGMTAGRPPALWVQWSWAVCVAVVAIGAFTRLTVSLSSRSDAVLAGARPGLARRLPQPSGRSNDKYARARTEQARAEAARSGRYRGGQPSVPVPRGVPRGGVPRGGPGAGYGYPEYPEYPERPAPPRRGGRPVRAGRPGAPGRGQPPAPGRNRPVRARPANQVPDEEFWSKLRAEVGPLSGGRP
jgi:hypothetical protein